MKYFYPSCNVTSKINLFLPQHLQAEEQGTRSSFLTLKREALPTGKLSYSDGAFNIGYGLHLVVHLIYRTVAQ